MTAQPVPYVIDGARIHTLDDVFTVVGEAVRGEGGYFGRNLDAFADCLTGGYGTPDDGRFFFVWGTAIGPARLSGTQRLRVSSSSVSHSATRRTGRRCAPISTAL
ncbi:hypothetical protein R1CP_34160 [Rhodococcus opacus]|uniref:Barstar (barnase inhibitor) domain-containing protein n=1 Tax=Rhodococcus opacus TaxID=37919 RepID=A0A1B1KFR1_RHOOP|nr:barstar family protein [Rhodococcus opacus]ANS31446.1 hypothetical protein R1CP_34160 [Rhodococcus opacus]